MGNLLFIDSDDINGLSDALRNALERRGIVFGQGTTDEFGYPMDENDEPDIDPYIGIMPVRRVSPPIKDDNDRWLFQESGGSYGYGGCGGHVCSSCGGGGPSYGGCGGYSYPRC
jgi:hypothetical protein